MRQVVEDLFGELRGYEAGDATIKYAAVLRRYREGMDRVWKNARTLPDEEQRMLRFFLEEFARAHSKIAKILGTEVRKRAQRGE